MTYDEETGMSVPDGRVVAGDAEREALRQVVVAEVHRWTAAADNRTVTMLAGFSGVGYNHVIQVLNGTRPMTLRFAAAVLKACGRRLTFAVKDLR